jgi:CubicO group peptidase (beta-lactamase class C family)
MRPVRLTLPLALAAALASLAAAANPPEPAAFARYAEDVLADAYDSDAPGAAVLVMRGDEVLYRGARGEADVDGDVPLTPDDLFRIGSVTKQIAAAGLLTLVDAGKVALDDPLSKYLPDYPGGKDITIEQLLNHTSGIKSYTDIPGVMEGPIQRDVTTAQLVDYFKDEAPVFAPGEAWGYNNSGYVLVGAVIEAASGQSWHAYLEDALFKPLGMKDTGYGADPAIVARQAKGYGSDGDGPTPPLQLSMTQPHAAGALVSTVDDLARWNRALHEGRVLKPETYARMITPVGKATDAGYGYGIGSAEVRGTPSYQHGGGIPGFTSQLNYVPGPDISVAVLLNSDNPGPGNEAQSVARRLTAAALGDPYPEVTPVDVDVAVLKQYEGVYRVDKDATRTLRVVDGKLTAQRTDRPREDLTPIAQDTFVYSDGFNRLKLERDAAGEVTGMRFWPEGEGEGVIAELTDQALPVAITLPREALERLVGVYTTSGVELTIALDGDALSGQIKGQPQAVPLVALSPNRFTGDIVGAELTFAPETGPAQRITMKQWGNKMEFERAPAGD